MIDTAFKPVRPTKPKTRAIMIQLEEEYYQLVVQAARHHGVSLKMFLRQALDFAMQHMEQPEG